MPDDLAGHRSLHVAPGLCGHVDHDGAGLHLLDHLGGDQHRRLPTGYGGGGDQRVRVGDVRRQHLALPVGPILGHLACVATRSLERLELEVDRLGTHRPDLLGGGRADVVRQDDRTQPLGRRDRLQPGDAGTEHDHLRGLHRAGGRHVQREETTQQPGRHDRAAIPGDQGLRGQRVHRLCAGDARDELQRERGDPEVAQVRDEVMGGVHRQEGHRGRAVAQPPGPVAAQSVHPEDHVGLGQRVIGDNRAGLDVELVGVLRAGTCLGLDEDLVAEVGQLADELGDHRDPGLALTGFPCYCDLHASEPSRHDPRFRTLR